MKKLTYLFPIALIFISAFLLTCKKEKDTGNQQQDVSFSIGTSNTKSGSALKSAFAYSLSDAKKIVLTIQNANGTPTNYVSSEVKIYQMNGKFFSQKIILKTGSYRLTEFLLIDSMGNTIFAVPLTGSPEAQNTTHPLPIAFDVIKDVSTPINLEVLSTENKSPADFGLVNFPITEVPVINFLITVVDKESNRLLSPKLTLSSNKYSYVQLLDTIANNRVTIKDNVGLNSYTLTIEEYGYQTYSHAYTKDSLKLFNSSGNHSPLLIELEREIVTDIDGNIYHTVAIGTQVWMVENLKTTRYNDGMAIPNVTDSATWEALTTPAYRWYKNDADTYKNDGAYYNWYVIGTGKLCPSGWHVPSEPEWNVLMNFINRYGYGFSAIPASSFRGKIPYWWTSSKMEFGNLTVFSEIVSPHDKMIRSFLTGNGKSGHAIRCIKD